MATTKKLVIAIDAEFSQHPDILVLQEAGHEIRSVVRGELSAGYDLYLSRRAWNWHDGMWGYLAVALKEARKIKYAQKETGEKRLKVSRKPRKPKVDDAANGVQGV